MNFYDHHIGDYDQATSHLTACEDGIYSRLIRWYYASEAPLPADIKAIERRVRAHSRDERAAVRTVLEEFFELQDDGYHQARCDEVIAEYRAKEPEREARRQNDAERQRRSRERRKHLFDQLRSHNIVPAFDTKTDELERLLSQALSRVTPTATKRDESRDVTHPVTRDNTATQYPLPTTHTTPSGLVRGSRLSSDWDPGEPGFAFAAQQGLTNGRVQAELAKFRDYWTAKTGAQATKTDWQATWRNWVRKAAENGRQPGAAPGARSFRERDLEVRSAEANAWMGSFAPASQNPPAQGDILDMPGEPDAPRLTRG